MPRCRLIALADSAAGPAVRTALLINDRLIITQALQDLNGILGTYIHAGHAAGTLFHVTYYVHFSIAKFHPFSLLPDLLPRDHPVDRNLNASSFIRFRQASALVKSDSLSKILHSLSSSPGESIRSSIPTSRRRDPTFCIRFLSVGKAAKSLFM